MARIVDPVFFAVGPCSVVTEYDKSDDAAHHQDVDSVGIQHLPPPYLLPLGPPKLQEEE